MLGTLANQRKGK